MNTSDPQPNQTSLGQRFSSKLALTGSLAAVAGILFNRPFSLPATATTAISYLLIGTLFFTSQEFSRYLRHNEDHPLNSTFAGLVSGGILSKLHPRRPSPTVVGVSFAGLATGIHLAYDTDTARAIRRHFTTTTTSNNGERDLFLSTFKILGMRKMTDEELEKYKEKKRTGTGTGTSNNNSCSSNSSTLDDKS